MFRQVEFSAVHELEVAQRILSLEDQLRDALLRVPACRSVLEAAGSTDRPGLQDRMAEAHRLSKASCADAPLLAAIRVAAAELEKITWHLALSATRVARREARRVPCRDVTIEDLEQDGVLGLLHAARRFDVTRGVRFAVYARWWVRAQITKAIQRANAFQVSAAVFELHRNMQKLRVSDEKEGRKSTASEIASRLGIRPQRLREVMAMDALQPVEDSDEPNGPSAIAELRDNEGSSPEESAAATEVGDWLRRAIQTSLAARERLILEQRNGIDCEPVSAADLATTLALSTERVRQLEVQSRAVLCSLFAMEMRV
jgi:RNA polymerase nonessential primary-like sigma factor